MTVDESIAVAIEHCEGFLHVKVVDEESCGNLVKNLVQSLLPELNSFKAFAESMQVYFTNSERIGYSAHDTLILHVER